MPDTWQRHPLLADFTLTGGEEIAAYGPHNVAGWTMDEHGDADVPTALILLGHAGDLVDRAVARDTVDGVAELDHADDLISARLLAAAAAATMTKVRAWAVFTTYAAGWGPLADRRTVWSSHFTEANADEWCTAWKEHYADRDDYEWHVALMPVDVGTLRRPGVAPRIRAR